MVALTSFVPQGVFNRAGAAGPRRLLIIMGTGAAMVALVVGVSMIGGKAPVESRAAPMPYINPLPGGQQTNAEQDALARVDAREHAAKALDGGKSYTPPMAPSHPFVAPPVVNADEKVPAPAPAKPAAMPVPAAPIHFQPAAAATAAPAAPIVEAAADTQAVQDMRNQMSRLFSGYEPVAPHTEMVLDAPGSGASGGANPGSVSAAHGEASPALPGENGAPKHVLVPTGRGVYAHTILSVSSDSGGPIVLQADSGPIAGDRMLGSFTREQDRLVVTVHTIIHQGATLGVTGLVIAPDSMETAIASSVDEHYISRLVLPTAAAFVQGLGQAIATSNTTSQIGALGTVTGFTHLDLAQQAGVGAGVAGAQVGKFLEQAAPKGATVNLASNVNVAVMFLADVTAPK
jgi:intracellular multiplication protein IcmE